MMVTTLYAALLALIYVALAGFVIHGRWKYQVGIGDGRNPVLAQRVRMHGNFSEYAPLGLILLFLVEFSGLIPLAVHVLGLMLVIGRVLHAWGIYKSSFVSFGRSAGMALTLLMLLISAVLLLWKIIAVALIPMA